MKSSTHQSFLDRRILIAAGMTLLLGTTPLVAQTGSNSGSTDSDRSTSSSRDTQSSSDTSTSRGSYGTSATGSSTATSGASTSGTTGSTSTTDTTDTTSVTGATGTTSSTDTAGGATTMTGRDNKLGWMERRFVSKVADEGMTEVELAKLAAQRASNPEVKSYAETLVKDHEMMKKDLTALASQKNVELDHEDLGSDRAVNRLSKKSGHEFDQEFVEQMIERHEDAVERFEDTAEDSKDADLKSFATKHVDKLREHLATAQSLRSTIMPTGRTDDSGLSTSGSTSTSSTTDATSGTSSSGSTSGTSGTTGTPGTDLGSSTNSGSGTGSTSSDSSSSGSTGSSSSDPSRTPRN